MSEQDNTDLLSAELTKLRADFLQRLPAELTLLESLANHLQEDTAQRTKLDDLHHRLHRLAGIPGVFELPDLSTQARVLEQRVKAWLEDSPEKMTSLLQQALIADIAALQQMLTEALSKEI